MRDGKMSGVSDTAVEPRSAVQIHRDSPLRRFSGLRAPQGSRETQNSHTKKKRTSKWLRIQARRMSLEKKGILKKKKRKSSDLGERGSTGTVALSPNAEAWEGLLSSDQCPDSAGLQSVDDARECLAVSAGKRGMASPGGHWDCDSGVSFDVSPSVSGHSSPCPGINPAKLIAMDCEMVGTGLGGRCSEVARCSLVNYYGEVVYDKYIKPQQPVVDYRTRWSGISKCHLVNAVSFKKARREILQILKGKVVVGHALHNDFQALGFIPPKHLIRDTSSTHLLRQLSGFSGRGCISLKRLAKVLLQRDIQVGQKGHSSVEDAVAALDLYKQVEGPWEEEMMMRTQSPMENSPFMEPVFSPSHYMQDQYWPEEITKPCE
ncbi:apoptosis-enhancing nuclease [Scleropages formosus]|nr:apoptosis-enhancing nuclease [Scleropages formosus]